MSDIEQLPGESLYEFARRKFEAETGRSADEAIPAKAPREPAPPVASRQWPDDLIPEPGWTRTPEQLAMDEELGKVSIVDAYNRWCRKMRPDVGTRRESIMVRCPNPAHPDHEPSAWLNLDKGDGGVGNCALCGGFDKYDIAAWGLNFDVPGYKAKEQFPLLRRRMAEDLGYTVVTQGKDEWLIRPEVDQPEARAQEPTTGATVDPPAAQPGEAAIPASPGIPDIHVEPLFEGELLDEPLFTPQFDWRTLPTLGADTFLSIWMEITSQSYQPEEFYFWLGLQAISTACGNNVKYEDARPFRTNLMLCLVGPTGVGKSLAMSTATHLLREALPWNPEIGSGVRMIKSPGSGEALVDQFHHEWTDPTDPKNKFILPVNGLLREDELATLASKGSRHGTTLREKIMELYDSPYPVEGQSRGAGAVTAENHFFNMMSSTQPGSMRKLLTDNDLVAGFLNRWVWVTGTPKFQPSITYDMLDTSPCYNPLRAITAWSSAPRYVGFDQGRSPAFAQWDQFFHDEIVPMSLDEDNAIAARLPLLIRKTMTLLAANDHSTLILPPHVETAIRLWNYLKDTYGLVGRQIGLDDVEDCSRRIQSYAMNHGSPFSVRDLRKSSGAKKHSLENILKAVKQLEQAGILEKITMTGQRVDRWQYVDTETKVRVS